MLGSLWAMLLVELNFFLLGPVCIVLGLPFFPPCPEIESRETGALTAQAEQSIYPALLDKLLL